MNDKTFSAELVNVEALKLPFVSIIYKVNEDEYRSGLLMIDTASNDNLLSSGIIQYINPDYATGNSKRMYGIQRKSAECAEYEMEFLIGNAKFEEKFYVHPVNLDGFCGEGLIMGIVGNNFLRNYGLVLDYQKQELYQNTDRVKVCEEDCSFYFPVSFGLSKFEIPAIAVDTKDNGKFFMFVDSGNDGNAITKHDLELMANNIEYTGFEATKTSIENNEKMKEARANFNILSLDMENNLHPVEYNGIFHVVDGYDHLIDMDDIKDKHGKPMHISGLLSSPFMFQNKWVIDFSIGAMYSLKESA